MHTFLQNRPRDFSNIARAKSVYDLGRVEMVVVDVASPCADVYAYVIGSSCVRVPDRGTRGAVIANELPFLGATGFCEHLVLDVDALARKGVAANLDAVFARHGTCLDSRDVVNRREVLFGRVEKPARIPALVQHAQESDECRAEGVGTDGVEVLVVVEIAWLQLQEFGFGVREIVVGNAHLAEDVGDRLLGVDVELTVAVYVEGGNRDVDNDELDVVLGAVRAYLAYGGDGVFVEGERLDLLELAEQRDALAVVIRAGRTCCRSPCRSRPIPVPSHRPRRRSEEPSSFEVTFFLIPASPSFQPGWLETQGKSALMDPGTVAAPCFAMSHTTDSR